VSLPIRLTVVMTHPVQYYGPWFRYITDSCPDIDLTVLYATQPTPVQQGVGFGVAFSWDIPLTEGYRCRFVRDSHPRDNIHSDSFWGLNVPGIVDMLYRSLPDVALVPGWHSVTLVRALLACRRRHIPVLYRGDTHLGNAPRGWRRRAWFWRTRLLLRFFDGYLSVGQRTRGYLARLGIARLQTFDVPHCVDNAFFAGSADAHRTPGRRADIRSSWGLSPSDFVVLFVGKLEPKKRPLDLIRAVARLNPPASVIVVGLGQLGPMCRAEADRLGVRVYWAGFRNQSELGQAYGVADCLVLPSDWGETWGLVVNEALASGLPCVVSDRVGCAPDLVTPGETGEVFRFGDVPSLAAALYQVRERGDAGYDWMTACRTRVGAYSFESATAGLLRACRAVTRRPLTTVNER
jgi:glycosyltransferase involved in cell wall biosynthesis